MRKLNKDTVIVDRKANNPKKPDADNITRDFLAEGEKPDATGLPGLVTLPDGRMFTNQDIVSLKRKFKYGHDTDVDKLWLEIEAHLVKSKIMKPEDKITKNRPRSRESGEIKTKTTPNTGGRI